MNCLWSNLKDHSKLIETKKLLAIIYELLFILFINQAVENLLEGARELPTEPELNQLALRFRDCHLIVLKAMADHRSYGTNWTSKNVTKWVA